MKTRTRLPILAAAISCVLAGHSTHTAASGFALIEQSVSGMGTAYAGGSAQAEDASTVYFNPAGLTRLPGRQFVAGAHLVIPQAEFRDRGSTLALEPLNPGGLGSEDGGNAGPSVAVVPNLYFSQQLGDRTFFGLGINPPFGLSTDYDRDWIGRYHADKSKITTINVNPALAFKATDRLSLGAGLNIQYVDAELTNSVDFGSIGCASLGVPTCTGLGLTPGASDGFLDMEGDDVSLGYNLGLLYEVSEGTRLGLHYRSSIKHTVEGDADFDVPAEATPLTAGGRFTDTDLKVNARLPESLSASIYHEITPRWAVMGDVTWTNWDRLPELRIEFDNPAQPDGVVTLEWEDTFRYSIGVAHMPNKRWTYRAGVAYDEEPIPSADLRTPRIPGNDRLWVAVGMGYKHSDQLTFDFGYAHLFVKDPKIAKTTGAPADEDFFRGALNGKYDAEVDILSAQVAWNF